MQLRYQPSLDGLRAIAIAAVVLYHATDFTFPATGQLGVDLFFVLSGFLITTILLDEHRRSGAVSLGSFYRRRALRLLPADARSCSRCSPSSRRRGRYARGLAGVAAGLGYVMNHALAGGHAEALPDELAHLWSLSAEEQFYLVWPLLLLGPLPRARRTCRVGVRDRDRPRSAAGVRPPGLGRVDPESRVRRRHALGLDSDRLPARAPPRRALGPGAADPAAARARRPRRSSSR